MPQNLHWRRFDWSFDSICPDCLATVAHANDEAALAEQEKGHTCDPEVLARQANSASTPPLTNAPRRTSRFVCLCSHSNDEVLT